MKRLIYRTIFIQTLIFTTLIGSVNIGYTLAINPIGDPAMLASAISGSGITVIGIPTLIGSPSASGTFTDGLSSGIGIESGILLTTGTAANAIGPNNNGSVHETISGGGADDDTTSDLGLPGDSDLTLLAGFDTFDATILEFDFTTTSGNLFFNFIFASEEYIDFVDTEFNDVFGFFVDGINIGLVPGTSDPITVNTINPLTNSSFYNNNIDPAVFDVEYDGFTDVISASALGLGVGTHHIKLAIADGSDHILDAGVFIEAPFSDTPTAPVPEPATIFLLAGGLGCIILRKMLKKKG